MMCGRRSERGAKVEGVKEVRREKRKMGDLVEELTTLKLQ